MIYFLSFANTVFEPMLERIGKEANDSNFFDKIFLFSEKNIDRNFWKSHKSYIKKYTRGFGYWLWKPYLIKSTLEKMEDGDILVYLDAGCEIHASGLQRWNEYKNLLNNYSLLVFNHSNCFENQYTKRDVLDFFEVTENEELLNSRQLWAGGLIMRKNDFTIGLMNRYYQICDDFRESLLCDKESQKAELSEYKQHRHDQSIFSVLCKVTDSSAYRYTDKGDIKVLPMNETFPPQADWSVMKDFPFWAKRNKAWKPKPKWKRAILKFFNMLSK